MGRKIIITILLTAVVLSFASNVMAKEASPMQFLYVVKQIFPDNPEIAVFISEDVLAKEENALKRAAAQTQLQPKIYIIGNSADIGKRMRELKPNTILIMFESELLIKKNTMLYVLSKCKENELLLVTSSKEYTELGALLGLLYDEDQLQVVLNLKHNTQLKPKFSQEFVQVVGIHQIIE